MENRKVKLISPTAGYSGLIARKVNRNDLCPCGSGKKSKKCCSDETKYYTRAEKTLLPAQEIQEKKLEQLKKQ